MGTRCSRAFTSAMTKSQHAGAKGLAVGLGQYLIHGLLISLSAWLGMPAKPFNSHEQHVDAPMLRQQGRSVFQVGGCPQVVVVQESDQLMSWASWAPVFLAAAPPRACS